MTTRHVAQRLHHIHPKATNVLAERLPELRARGLDPINLATARPDFDTPQPIKAAAQDALEEPLTYILYSDSRGLLELREAVAEKLARDNGLRVDPAAELIVTAGTHEALTVALLAIVDPGDEVILFDPSWVAYQGMVRLAGGRPTFARLEGGRLDVDALRAAMTPATRAILFNNPNNPTGTVFTRHELEAIARLAIERDLVVVVDEIYEHFLFDGRVHHSIGALPGMAERTVTINGVSKAFAMTGWRIGYAAAAVPLATAMLTVHQHVISSPCTFAQKGAVEAFGAERGAFAPMVDAYRRRRDALAPELAHLPNVRAPIPEGACFFFLAVDVGLDSEALSDAFLERGGLLLTPGSAFGPSGAGHVRLSYAGLPEDRVPEVVRRLRLVLDGIVSRAPYAHGKEHG